MIRNTGIMAALLLVLLGWTSPAYANYISSITPTLGCGVGQSTLVVTGTDLVATDNYVVIYSVTYTPSSGPATTVNASVPVSSTDAAGDFTVTITLPPAPSGVSTVTGTAELYDTTINSTYQGVIPIVFSPATLICGCTPTIPSEATATSSGSAYEVAVTLLGLNLTPTPLVPSSSSQTGPGTNGNSAGPLLPINLEGLVAVNLGLSSSNATITSTGASDESISTTGVINLLNLVQATALVADARAFASPSDATYSTAGTIVEGLVVAGVPVNSIYPNEVIPLPDGGTVTLLEETGTTGSAGGRSTADLSINLIHIRVPAIKLGSLTLVAGSDIVIGHAEAHANSPLETLCPGQPVGSVSAEAFAAEVAQGLDPALNTDKVDDISIPSTGGSGALAVHGFNLALGGVTIGSGTVSETVNGVVGSSSSAASASSTVQSLCLLNTTPCNPVNGVYPSDGIALSAVTADSASTVNGAAASSSPAGTTIATLSIAGTVINPLALPPNTTLGIPGIATVTINEQIPETGSNGTTDTGLTVNLLHVRLLGGGADIIVSSAHSDAHFK